MNLPVIILGGSGHAGVVLDTLCCMSRQVLGYLAPVQAVQGGCTTIAYLGTDQDIANYPPGSVLLANGLGSVGLPERRARLFSRFRKMGYGFVTLVHPGAIVAAGVELGQGCQIMAGAVLQPGVSCAENVIVNTRAGLDHDCSVGAHSHVAVGAILSGEVQVGRKAHIGAGSIVIQNIQVGHGTVVAAGAVVVRNVEDNETVAGVPASRMKR